jgi:hypothetical protein
MKFPVPPPLREKPRRKPVAFMGNPELRRIFFGSVIFWMSLFLIPTGIGLFFLPFSSFQPSLLAWLFRLCWIWMWMLSGFFCGHWAGRRLTQSMDD